MLMTDQVDETVFGVHLGVARVPSCGCRVVCITDILNALWCFRCALPLFFLKLTEVRVS
jgi:hypothetical protein